MCVKTKKYIFIFSVIFVAPPPMSSNPNHIQQNGFSSSTNSQVVPPSQVTASQLQQNYAQQNSVPGGNGGGSAHGTWSGSNTLTYTQSMQPPDVRQQRCTPYCKLENYFVFLFY